MRKYIPVTERKVPPMSDADIDFAVRNFELGPKTLAAKLGFTVGQVKYLLGKVGLTGTSQHYKKNR